MELRFHSSCFINLFLVFVCAANQGCRALPQESGVPPEQAGGPAGPIHAAPEAEGWGKFRDTHHHLAEQLSWTWGMCTKGNNRIQCSLTNYFTYYRLYLRWLSYISLLLCVVCFDRMDSTYSIANFLLCAVSQRFFVTTTSYAIT